MICARCGSETVRMTCESCGQLAALDRRWRLDRILAHRPWGTSWQGRDLSNRAEVVVVAFPLPADESSLDLARQRAQGLVDLQHPGVADYLGHLEIDILEVPHVCTVHGYIRGWNLQAEADTTPHTEEQVVAILAELLDTLAWLHSRPRPVVHGAIHPYNIIRRELDRRLVLVDFTGVRDAVRLRARAPAPLEPGYNAPEQAMDRPATPGSDLWALGALAVRLLSGREPTDLWADGRLQWQPHVFASPDLMLLLSDLLQTDPSRRPSDAGDVAEFVRELL